MRLHILPDQKIIDRTIETFEHVFPNDNKYLVIVTDRCKYVKSNGNSIIATSYDSKDFWQFIGNVDGYDSIIIHSMTKYAAQFINRIEHNRIYWIEWGVDLYNNMLGPRGYKLYTDINEIEKFVYKTIWTRFAHRYFTFLYPSKTVKKAINKVHYFVPDSMYDEYPLLLSYYPQYKHLEYKEFFYYPIDQVIDKSIRDERCHGDNIVVGNSCSFTGNHLEIIRILSSLDLNDRKVKFPINYAGTPEYRNYIIENGNKLLGQQFEPLLDFMTLDDYNRYLLDASFFIYNNYRQEAVGNILVALYIGGKVYLSDKSPLLKFYKTLGLIIYPVSSLSHQSLNEPLNEEDINKNRAIIEKHYSLNRLYSLVKQNFV